MAYVLSVVCEDVREYDFDRLWNKVLAEGAWAEELDKINFCWIDRLHAVIKH